MIIDKFSEYLKPDDVDKSTKIVAQLGPEPMMKALDFDVDGVIAGRSLDVGIVSAYPLKERFDEALAFHMAKVLECGAVASEPGSASDGLFGILRKDHFLLRPPNPKRRCTVTSVAAHSFYERDNLGMELFDERTVRVTGSRFVPTPYTVKIEGVRLVGYRTICIAGIRDPLIIHNINSILQEVMEDVEDRLSLAGVAKDEYAINFRIYGKDGVAGPCEPIKEIRSHELCVVIDVVARTQELTNGICTTVDPILLHHGYKGIKTTAGNLAIPFSPSDIAVGPVYTYNIWHALELDDPCEPFKIKILEFPL